MKAMRKESQGEDDPGEVDLGYEESVSSRTGEEVWRSVKFEVGLNYDIYLGRNKSSSSAFLFFLYWFF
jgi:hypothetical protein